VIVNLGEPVAGTGGNHHDVSGLQLIRLPVLDFGSVVPRTVELHHGRLRRRTPLPVRDVGTKDQRRLTGNDVVDLADLIMLGNRIRSRLVELATIYNADADMRFPDVDIAHLLVDQFFRNRFLAISLYLGKRNIRSRTHVARGLRIGGIHFVLGRDWS